MIILWVTGMIETINAGAAARVAAGSQGTHHLMAVLQDEVARQRLPGAVALIAHRGELLLFDAVGALDPAHGMAMPLDAIFRIYSMTKPIVSVATMMLIEQGKLAFDDPLSGYLNEFTALQVAEESAATIELRATRQEVTIRDLLRHTAGFTYEFLGSSAVQRRYAQARIGSRSLSNVQFSHQLAALPLRFEPGSMWEYSRATDVLGRVIEVVSGQTLGHYLQCQLFQPLRMIDSGFWVPPESHARIAEPFARDPEGGLQMRLIDVRNAVAMESGGGGLVCTALDYARFLQLLLNRGEFAGQRLLSGRSVDLMCQDQLGEIAVSAGGSRDLLPIDHGFGFGFAVRRALTLAQLPGAVGSYFWGGMAGTTFFVDPGNELFACLMLQAPNQREYYQLLFRQLVYAAFEPG